VISGTNFARLTRMKMKFQRGAGLSATLAIVAMLASGTQPASAQARTSRKSKPAPVKAVSEKRAPQPAWTSTAGVSALSSAVGSALAAHTRGGEWGAIVVSLTRGDTLFVQNADAMMQPASTMKMYTSAVALDRFGPDYTFRTPALRDGQVGPDGTLSGNLYLRGSGDPSLSSRFWHDADPMDELAKEIAKAGVKRVHGDIVGDPSAFDEKLVPDGWKTSYLGAAYAARVSALSLNENLVWVAVQPNGNKAEVTLEPATTAIPVESSVTLSTAVEVAAISSPPLAQIVGEMDRESINICAELLFRATAHAATNQVGSAETGLAHLRDFMSTKVGTKPSVVNVSDGSGLSLNDSVTARSMVQLLGFVHKADWGPVFHAALPVEGESGTLKRHGRGTPSRGNLHAKTGTTNTVAALGGYVTAKNGEVLAFSLIYNGADRGNAKAAMDQIGATMAEFVRE